MNLLFLSNSTLFKGNSIDEIQAILKCLNTTQKKYKKDEIIYHTGDIINTISIVLSGSVTIENIDAGGNKSILHHIGINQIFAEAYACLLNEPLMINAVANENCEILNLDMTHLLDVCSSNCMYHQRFIHNLLIILANKNVNLSQRITHTSSKSIRSRLLSYLFYQSKKQGNTQIIIPFNRQQLADYLNVDRSALSNELSKMQKDGMIEYHKNHFKLKYIEEEKTGQIK